MFTKKEVKAKRKLIKNLSKENWLITTDDFNNPRLIHKESNISFNQAELEEIKGYLDNVISLFGHIIHAR